jgi:hypothetical protein
MAITVSFRGPMLFDTDSADGDETKDVVDPVIIPDATDPGLHHDNTVAKVHNAGLLVIRPGEMNTFHSLRGRTVTISGHGETGAPGVDSDFLSVPPIHEMTNPEGTKGDDRVRRRATQSAGGLPAVITLRGGKLSGKLITENGIEMPVHLDEPRPRRLTSMPVWDSQATSVKIVLEGNGEPAGEIELTGSDEAFVYNWDIGFPTRSDLVEPLDPTSLEEPFQDDDFKWVYRLLEPPGGDWTEWLDSDEFLPAPRSVGFDPTASGSETDDTLSPPNPPTSTCDCARCRGMDVV